MLEIPRQFNAAAYFIDRNVAEGRCPKIAIESADTGECISYAELHSNVNRCGNALRALGVRMEERVALLLLDSPEFFYAFFGAIKIGAVPVPLNTLLKPHDYEYLLNDCRARVLIVSAALAPQIAAIPRDALACLEHILVAGEAAQSRTTGPQLAFADLLRDQPSQLAPAPTCSDDVAFWLYSSGSTGRPKGCVHLQHDMPVCAERYARGVLGIREDDRCFSVAKLFFAYGLGNAGYFPLAIGATSIVWSGSNAPPNVFRVIAQHRPTLFFSVPSNYAALLAYDDAPPGPLAGIRWAVSAGEALPAALYHRFRERFGVEILDAVGSTEALHMFIANRPGAVRPGSSGQIIPGFEARILDESGAPIAAGEIGNLFIKSDAVCAAYWNQHEKSKETLQGHWIKTGDKYRQDEDGYFWYCGRSDDMMKISGMWVSPIEIESALMEHAAVLEAAVVARHDGSGLPKPHAFVVLRNGAAASPALAGELQEFVSARIARYKRPRSVEFVAELPKTATGKIQRFRLREPS
jgi:benzoate-CoA ligase family protein